MRDLERPLRRAELTSDWQSKCRDEWLELAGYRLMRGAEGNPPGHVI